MKYKFINAQYLKYMYNCATPSKKKINLLKKGDYALVFVQDRYGEELFWVRIIYKLRSKFIGRVVNHLRYLRYPRYNSIVKFTWQKIYDIIKCDKKISVN